MCTSAFRLNSFLLYFFKLGAVGFGGPIALVNSMHRDLVVDRQWITPEEYKQGLAFSQLSPGPLATQLAMYLGWVRTGWLGATFIGILFVLPPFIFVVILAAAYLHYGRLPWIPSVSYGVGAAVIGIIGKSSIHLIQKTIGRDRILWLVFLISMFLTGILETQGIIFFVLAGFGTMLIKAPPKICSRLSGFVPAGILTGLHGEAPLETLKTLAFYFGKMGSIVFGSGLAIVPFLHGGVVQTFGWLTEPEFLDSIAIGMITPGPILITSGFVGYLTAGPLGAAVATFSIFFPCYLFVVVLAPFYRKLSENLQAKAFISGVTAAAIGGIAGGAMVLGSHSLRDLSAILIAAGTFAILIWFKKFPEPLLILLAGLVGFYLRR